MFVSARSVVDRDDLSGFGDQGAVLPGRRERPGLRYDLFRDSLDANRRITVVSGAVGRGKGRARGLVAGFGPGVTAEWSPGSRSAQ